MQAAGVESSASTNTEAVEEFFNKLDANGDGKITEEEFVQGATKVPQLVGSI